MEYLVLAMVLGLIPAKIAGDKGRSFGGWWIFGSLLFIIALPMSLMISKDTTIQHLKEGHRKCPKCAEWVQSAAQVCRYCSAELTPMSPADINEKLAESKELPGWILWPALLLTCLIVYTMVAGG